MESVLEMMSGTMIVVVVAMMVVMALGVAATLLRGPNRRSRSRNPRDVLAERYARGELDDQEYERRQRMLDERHR